MIAKLKALIGEARKALTAASGAVAELVALGLLHGTAERWTQGVLAAATAAAVYLVPNKAKPVALRFGIYPAATTSASAVTVSKAGASKPPTDPPVKG